MAETRASCADSIDPESIPRHTAVQHITNAADQCPALDTEFVSLSKAAQRILATDYIAQRDIPPHPASAMDGIAVRAKDCASLPCTLPLVGKSLAGHPYTGPDLINQAIRITTGAVVPLCCDTVIMQEQVVFTDDNNVEITRPVQEGNFVRPKASDIHAGKTLLKIGHKLQPADLALLASDGCQKICVFRRLKVAIMSTGDEVVEPGQALSQGQIYDANRYALAALLEQSGCEVIDFGIIADTESSVASAIDKATSSADITISTGGVSVGEADFIRPLVAKRGQLAFWKVAVKPGRPLTFAPIGQSLYFGLPGNPVSTIVSFQLFVIPAIRARYQQVTAETLYIKAKSLSRLKKQPGREEFQRGQLVQKLTGEFEVQSAGLQDSHALHGVVNGNCYIYLANESTGAEIGDQIDVIPYSALT